MQTSKARPALLLCAHGSQSSSWADRIAALTRDVAQRPAIRRTFGDRVRHGFLEGVGPSISTALAQLRAAGATLVVAIPVFLTSSSHVDEDVPEALGLSADAPRGATGCEIVLGTPLASSSALGQNAAERLLLAGCGASDTPEQTAVVLAYYGSPRHPQPWADLVASVGGFLTTHAGFAHASGVPIGHWVTEGPRAVTNAVREALAEHPRVAVLPLLISHGPHQTAHIPAGLAELTHAERKRVSYSDTAILPSAAIANWIESEALRVRRGA